MRRGMEGCLHRLEIGLLNSDLRLEFYSVSMKLIEKPGDSRFLGSSELPLGDYIDRRELNGHLEYLDSRQPRSIVARKDAVLWKSIRCP